MTSSDDPIFADDVFHPGALIAAGKMMYEVVSIDDGIVYADDCVEGKRWAFVVNDVLADFELVRAAPAVEDTPESCSSSATSI